MNDDILDNADNLFFTEVEDEDGMNVELNETMKSNLAGLIEARYVSAEQAREYDEKHQTHPTPVSYTHLTLPTIYSV